MSASTPTIAEDTAVAVLAAGAGTRFGGGKLDAMLAGRPLGAWATGAVEAAGAKARVIVVPPAIPHFVSALDGWTVVENPTAARGIGTSLRAAVEAARRCPRLIVVLADMPLVSPAHLLRLDAGPGLVFTRQADGCPGTPAAFPAACFDALMQLPDDAGAARLAAWPEARVIAPEAEHATWDADRPGDLARIARWTAAR